MTHATILAAAREMSPTMLFSWNLHVFPLPKSVYPFVIHLPATSDQQPVNAFCSETWTLPGQNTHLLKQSRFLLGPT
jgi:hypothetical protein